VPSGSSEKPSRIELFARLEGPDDQVALQHLQGFFAVVVLDLDQPPGGIVSSLT